MSVLNPARLRNEVESRDARKIKIFEHILQMCNNKIMIANQQTDECCCIFICPSVVFGQPLFNLMDCIKYIMIKLVEKGFEVHLAIPNNIFISWKHNSNPNNSRNLYQLEAPIINNTTTNTKNNKLSLMHPHTYSTQPHTYSNKTHNDYKLFMNKTMHNKKEKNYRPINDYMTTSINSNNTKNEYTLDDIELFHNKLDEILK